MERASTLMRMIDEERKGRTTLHDDEVNKALDVVGQAIRQHRDGKHKDYKPPEEGEINRRALGEGEVGVVPQPCSVCSHPVTLLL